MRDIDIYTEFDMFEVKVPIIFLGTVGFSLRREGRYSVSLHLGLGPSPSLTNNLLYEILPTFRYYFKPLTM
jgi:hypothetical protein